MKTLRDDVQEGLPGCVTCRIAEYDKYVEGFADAMSKYEDWRVVEGVLEEAYRYRAGHRGRFIVLRVEEGDPSYVNLGKLGDHVKLILPPEEEKPDKIDWHFLALEREGERDRARVRADRFEEVLWDIVDVRTGPLGVAREMKRKAGEVLDEQHGQ